MDRRSMLKGGLAVIPAAVVAIVDGTEVYSQIKIVIDENIHDDPKATETMLKWAGANGMDPMHWGLPVTINNDQKTITGPYYPELDAPFHYERTVPLRVPLPKSLVGD